MNTFTTRKSSGRRTALLYATVLLSASPAFAAVSADDAQAQARALLSGTSASRTDDVLPSLPAAAGVVSTTDAAEQARALLFGTPTFPRARDRVQALDSMTTEGLPASAQDQRSANAGALESARRMILGSGA